MGKMSRIERETRTVRLMIGIYCRGKEGNAKLCGRCEELAEYARRRLERCPFGEGKSSCKRCRVHCYNPEMRERIRLVMRYSGPRMMIYHPIAAIRHLLGR